MEPSAEGAPILLAEKRTLSFADRKIVVGSTPLIEETSTVLRSYGASDQRVFEVPCPSCGGFTEVLWQHIELGIRASRDGSVPVSALRELDRRAAQAGDGRGGPLANRAIPASPPTSCGPMNLAAAAKRTPPRRFRRAAGAI